MKSQSIGQYYWFGTCVRYLQDVSAGASIHGRRFVLWNIKEFKGDLERLGLHVTARVTERLLQPLINELSKLEKNSK